MDNKEGWDGINRLPPYIPIGQTIPPRVLPVPAVNMHLPIQEELSESDSDSYARDLNDEYTYELYERVLPRIPRHRDYNRALQRAARQATRDFERDRAILRAERLHNSRNARLEQRQNNRIQRFRENRRIIQSMARRNLTRRQQVEFQRRLRENENLYTQIAEHIRRTYFR